MTNEFVFKVALFVLIMSAAAIRLPYMKKLKESIIVKEENLKSEKFNVFVAWLGMCLVPFIYIFSNLLNGFSINFSTEVRIAAAVLFAFNMVYFYFIHKELNKNWSPVLVINSEQTLVTSGLYRFIRHPMYLQSWLWVVLQLFLTSNWVVGIVGIATWGYLYTVRIHREEKMMIDKFGDEYKDYMRKTGRIIPSFNSLKNLFKDNRTVCPVNTVKTLDSPIRNFFTPFNRILTPYLKEGMTFLDIGCGVGRFSIKGAEIVKEQGKVIALDIQKGVLDIVENRVNEKNLQGIIQTHLAEADNLNLNIQADFGLAMFVVHEVPNFKNFFDQVKLNLNAGGKFLVVEPNFHVSEKLFAEEIEAAKCAGLNVISTQQINILCKSVLLEKK